MSCGAGRDKAGRASHQTVTRREPASAAVSIAWTGNPTLYSAAMDGLYGLLLSLAWAVVLPYQFVIACLGGAPVRLRERRGFMRGDDGPGPGCLWIHAVSVGEVRLARLLLGRLRRDLPGLRAHLTTATATGRALALGPAADPTAPDAVSQFPFDLPGPIGRLLDRLRPRAVVVVETEIWPNLLRLCEARAIPVALVNGRISPRSFRSYRLVRPLLRRALRRLSLLAMQSEDDAGRIRALGAEPGRIRMTGNLKYDLPAPAITREEARHRLSLPAGVPLFVAGSTAPGEETPVALAFATIRGRFPSARLIVAPRHPERFAEAAAILAAAGLRVTLWSERGDATAGWDCLLVDRLGILPSIYAACDVAFVGGSLVRRGGQNMLEPAALGVPVLYGPRTENFRAAAGSLAAAGGGFVVHDGRQMGEAAVGLLVDPARHAAAAAAGRRVVAASRGALDRTAALLAPLLAAPAAGDPGVAATAAPGGGRDRSDGVGQRA